MRTELVTDLLYDLDRKGLARVGECSEALKARLLQLPLPTELSVLFWHDWLTEPGSIGPYSIGTLEEILNESDPLFQRLLKDSMIQVGYAQNGDPLVFCWSEGRRCEVGLVSHDVFWENDALRPSTVYARETPTVEEFLFRSVEGMYLPLDYYVARDLQALREELKPFGSCRSRETRD